MSIFKKEAHLKEFKESVAKKAELVKEKEIPKEDTIKKPHKEVIFAAVLIATFVIVIELVSNLEISYPFSKNTIINIAIILLLVVFGLLIYKNIKYSLRGKEKIQKSVPKSINDSKDVKKVLKSIDKLLVKLPKEEIKKFSNSEESKLYEQLMEKYR